MPHSYVFFKTKYYKLFYRVWKDMRAYSSADFICQIHRLLLKCHWNANCMQDLMNWAADIRNDTILCKNNIKIIYKLVTAFIMAEQWNKKTEFFLLYNIGIEPIDTIILSTDSYRTTSWSTAWYNWYVNLYNINWILPHSVPWILIYVFVYSQLNRYLP